MEHRDSTKGDSWQTDKVGGPMKLRAITRNLSHVRRCTGETDGRDFNSLGRWSLGELIGRYGRVVALLEFLQDADGADVTVEGDDCEVSLGRGELVGGVRRACAGTKIHEVTIQFLLVARVLGQHLVKGRNSIDQRENPTQGSFAGACDCLGDILW